jgi:hypothetical protein
LGERRTVVRGDRSIDRTFRRSLSIREVLAAALWVLAPDHHTTSVDEAAALRARDLHAVEGTA